MNGEQASASAGASYKNRWEVDDDPALLSMTAIGVYAEELHFFLTIDTYNTKIK